MYADVKIRRYLIHLNMLCMALKRAEIERDPISERVPTNVDYCPVLITNLKQILYQLNVGEDIQSNALIQFEFQIRNYERIFHCNN